MKVNVRYPKMMLCGEIDFIEVYDVAENIVEIKCVKEISIRYYVQLMLYNFCYYYEKKQYDKLFSNNFKIVNLLTGLEHFIVISISPANMFNLLITLAEIGSLTFSNMNLVYDLETTDRIEQTGPFDYAPTAYRCVVNKRDKYYGTIYPEITEISIKDYETGMILIDTLVKPNKPIHPEVELLTGITTNMLINQPDINMIRSILEKKMIHFANCKMMAHNGNTFDNKIILYDKLIDSQKITFIDTLTLIPIHLPGNMKLKNKKLSNIYYELFHETFNAHRAMSDVDALIRIMKHIGIEF
jgi:DNA polymerase III epsilon subunit-like protein